MKKISVPLSPFLKIYPYVRTCAEEGNPERNKEVVCVCVDFFF